MGLDMYARKTTKDRIISDTQIKVRTDEEYEAGKRDEDIHYWRKHPALHGWMEEIYRKKGGTEDFNCVPVVLSLEDLNELEQVILNNELPKNITGFFFGESQFDEEQKKDDLEFVVKARKEIMKGNVVYYTSWW